MGDTTRTSGDHFSIGVALDGTGWHPSSWREPGSEADRVFTANYWGELATRAEAEGFDYLTIDDSLTLPRTPSASFAAASEVPPRPDPAIVSGRLDAALLASWIAPRTERIGLIPTVTTTHTEPFHVATGLQTLDHVSLGRAGWQVRISGGAAEAAAFGRKPAPGLVYADVAAGRAAPALTDLLDEAAEAAEVARRLWDSWQDDAIVKDVATGRFLDRDRVHYIDFESAHFSVIGPSIVPRSPQGQLPITVLAHSAPIYRLAALAADVVFITPHPDPAAFGVPGAHTAPEIVTEIRGIEADIDREGRGLAPLRIVADLVIALDSDTETGADRVARLDALGTPFFSDAHLAAGSARQIADLIVQLRDAGVEGIRLRPLANADDLPAIGRLLFPELRARGLGPTPPSDGATLRDRFGLAPAVNRYVTSEPESTTATATKEPAA